VPGVRIILSAICTAPLGAQTETGEVDLAAPTPEQIADALRSRPLFEERSVFFARLGHPPCAVRWTHAVSVISATWWCHRAVAASRARGGSRVSCAGTTFVHAQVRGPWSVVSSQSEMGSGMPNAFYFCWDSI
jgi:DNA-binding transcriptional LysR family regulator